MSRFERGFLMNEQSTTKKCIALRMERQHLLTPANETEYDALYRDLQPGQNVYWNGFGQPPTLSFRADFDDLAYNKSRQLRRELIKGRFAGGNLLSRKEEIIAAVQTVNSGALPQRFMGKKP